MNKMLMKGNEAIGEAAVRAGCLNYFGYPITPQSEIAEYLARRLPQVGGVFLQGESEVAVSYMIYGAAAAGVRVMTSSSSPGISLMSEAVSYLVGAECPAVFVNMMRGGPGLGGILPSQADYFQAVRGVGHGDCRLLVLAPAGVQEAADMVMQSFPLAEKYRNPVMILGDGLIGQMMEPVEFSDNQRTDPPDNDEWATTGRAFRRKKERNVVKSLHLNPEELCRHNFKLKAKYDRMRKTEVRFDTINLDKDYRVLIVSYGTMSRVCRTAIEHLESRKMVVAMIRPMTLFPFPDEAIHTAAAKKSCRAVFSIEMSMGQMVEDVARVVAGSCPVHWFGKSGGEIPTPEEIVEVIQAV